MFMNGGTLLAGNRLTGVSSAGLAAKPPTFRRAASHQTVVPSTSVASQVPYAALFRLESPIGVNWHSAGSSTSGLQTPICHSASSQQEIPCSWFPDASMPQDLSGTSVPYSIAGITDAYLLGSAAVAATGQLQQACYDWAYAVLLFMAWQQDLTAKQQSAADEALRAKHSKPMAASRKSLFQAEAGLEKARRDLRNRAEDFVWHLLSTLNSNGYEPGLAYERLASYLQEFTYHLLLKCKCISSWGQPIYRQLPAIAAAVRPGVVVTVPVKQYLAITQHTPAICRQEMDGTWWGDAQLRIHPFQVVTQQELAKALGPDALLLLFKSGGSFAADLAAAAAKVGILDGAAAAAACSTSSSSSLAELLLSKLSHACIGMSAAALASIWTAQQQETSSTVKVAALAVGDLDCSCCCLTCACGGSGGIRRGSITAVGSGDFDGDKEAGAAPVLVCKTSRSWKNVGNAVNAAKSSNNRRGLGVLSKAKSLLRRVFRR